MACSAVAKIKHGAYVHNDRINQNNDTINNGEFDQSSSSSRGNTTKVVRVIYWITLQMLSLERYQFARHGYLRTVTVAKLILFSGCPRLIPPLLSPNCPRSVNVECIIVFNRLAKAGIWLPARLLLSCYYDCLWFAAGRMVTAPKSFWKLCWL